MGRLDFLYRMELPHRAVAVYLYLYDRANRDGECWPSIPTIARELKLSESTVRRAIQDLKKRSFSSLSKGTVPGAARAACFFISGNRDHVKISPSAKGQLRPFGERWYLA